MNGNGLRRLTATIVTSVVIALLVSGGGAFVTVQVMSVDLDRAKIDLAAADHEIRSIDRELVALKAAKAVTDQSDDRRWQRIEAELVEIRETQTKILGTLSQGRPRWRASGNPR